MPEKQIMGIKTVDSFTHVRVEPRPVSDHDEIWQGIQSLK
jgi:hypothetical protein